jgi:hypothetical protein
MSTSPLPGSKKFQVALVMSALWIGANTLLLWKAYVVERIAKPKIETSFSVAKLHANGPVNLLKSEIL